MKNFAFSIKGLKIVGAVVLLLIFVSMTLSANTAFAHKVRIFAYKDGQNIICEAQFNGGKPAQKSTIEVYAAEQLLLSGTTDSKGIFRFPIPQLTDDTDLSIIVNSGDGHRAEWLLRATDYLNVPPTKEMDEISVKNRIPQTEVVSHKQTTSLTKEDIQQIVQQELDRQLAPIRRSLAQEANGDPTLQDILGGIGYIFGLIGIAAYFTFRKKEKKQ